MTALRRIVGSFKGSITQLYPLQEDGNDRNKDGGEAERGL